MRSPQRFYPIRVRDEAGSVFPSLSVEWTKHHAPWSSLNESELDELSSLASQLRDGLQASK